MNRKRKDRFVFNSKIGINEAVVFGIKRKRKDPAKVWRKFCIHTDKKYDKSVGDFNAFMGEKRKTKI